MVRELWLVILKEYVSCSKLYDCNIDFGNCWINRCPSLLIYVDNIRCSSFYETLYNYERILFDIIYCLKFLFIFEIEMNMFICDRLRSVTLTMLNIYLRVWDEFYQLILFGSLPYLESKLEYFNVLIDHGAYRHWCGYWKGTKVRTFSTRTQTATVWDKTWDYIDYWWCDYTCVYRLHSISVYQKTTSWHTTPKQRQRKAHRLQGSIRTFNLREFFGKRKGVFRVRCSIFYNFHIHCSSLFYHRTLDSDCIDNDFLCVNHTAVLKVGCITFANIGKLIKRHFKFKQNCSIWFGRIWKLYIRCRFLQAVTREHATDV